MDYYFAKVKFLKVLLCFIYQKKAVRSKHKCSKLALSPRVAANEEGIKEVLKKGD